MMAQPQSSKASVAAAAAETPEQRKLPTVILVIGMAGSGKTTFMQRTSIYLKSQKKTPYVINLDPAVMHVPFDCNIDIRDTVDYKQVMKRYDLGPNGAILTSLNLFATKFDQVIEYLKKRAGQNEYVLIDTPGQIEIFTWSASGSIITDAIASIFPTVIAYVVDTPRSVKPVTFMSNMLYACSILYKTKLPFTVCFNKIDVQSHHFAVSWMTDFEALQESISTGRIPAATSFEELGSADQRPIDNLEGEGGYMTSFVHSMSLVLEEFYANFGFVGVSAATGAGLDKFLEAISDARKEYFSQYVPEVQRLIKEKMKGDSEKKAENLAKLVKDLNLSDGGAPGPAFAGRVVMSGQRHSEGLGDSLAGREPLQRDPDGNDDDPSTSGYYKPEIDRHRGEAAANSKLEFQRLTRPQR